MPVVAEVVVDASVTVGVVVAGTSTTGAASVVTGAEAVTSTTGV